MLGGAFVGEVFISFSIGRIGVDDLTNLIPLWGFDDAVWDNSFITRILLVDELMFADELGEAVTFRQGAKVDSLLWFGLVPEGVVNAGAVPEIEGFFA